VTVVGFLLALFVLPAAARAAQDDPVGAPGRPWADGVPQEQQDQALRIFQEGNALFEASEHAAALAKYREALKSWDHPAIRFNAAVALINLDQPLRAFENLELALRYGDAPLGTEKHQQALTYRKLLVGQIAELKVACPEQGAEVSLDGQALFVGPGEAARWLMPGAHQLVARKPGFLTETRSLVVLPGKPLLEQLTLQDIRSLPTNTVRRWPAWKPWSVVGAGALLAVIGVPVIVDSLHNVHDYEAAIDSCSARVGGPCMVPSTASDTLHRARVENVVAISLFSVGAAVAASGLAMAILNQPRVMQAEETAHASLTPLFEPGLVGLQVALRR
jgi:tetratricopeptide (TPR) repeat protein